MVLKKAKTTGGGMAWYANEGMLRTPNRLSCPESRGSGEMISIGGDFEMNAKTGLIKLHLRCGMAIE